MIGSAEIAGMVAALVMNSVLVPACYLLARWMRRG